MSLRVFHILFITVSLLAALFAGFWGVGTYAAEGEAMPLVLGLLALLSVPVLAVYGVKVRAKLRELDV